MMNKALDEFQLTQCSVPKRMCWYTRLDCNVVNLVKGLSYDQLRMLRIDSGICNCWAWLDLICCKVL
eukprot:593032-Karenia_brevis.AAC.1